MNPWLLLLLMSLTTYRATRLITRDDFPPVLWVRDRLAGGWRPLSLREQERDPIISPVDDALASHHPTLGSVMRVDGQINRYVRRASWSPYWLAELVSCPWCVSGWIAGILTTAVAFTVGVPVPLLVWPAVWGAGALLAARDWA